MRNRKTGKISNILFLCWFILTPVFWHLDISKGTYSTYDMFVMAPYGVFHLIVFYAIGAASIYYNKISLHHILLFSLYFPSIQLANYPYLTGADVYAHAAPAKTIIANGRLSYSGNVRPESFPGSFYLHAILTIVSGCDLINTNYILYLSSIIIITLVLYSFARLLEKKDYRIAWASALLFPCLFFNHLFAVVRYSRTTLAFVLLFLFFLSFMRHQDRRGSILQVLIVISIVITHPFQSLAMLAILFACVVLSSSETRPKNLTLFATVTFVGWMLFQSYSIFQGAIAELFFSSDYTTPIAGALQTRETFAWWGPILSDYFRYSFGALLAVASFVAIIVLLKTKRHRITIGLSSFLLSSIVVLSSLLPLPYWGIARSTAFAAFPAAFSSLILLEEVLKKEKMKRLNKLFTKKSMSTILLLFVVSLSAAGMVLRFRTNSYFGEMYHPSELSSLSFFFTHDYNSTVYIVSWQTSAYSSYFNYNSSHETLRLWHTELQGIKGNYSKFELPHTQLVNESQFVIRGMRDSYTLFQGNSGEAFLRTLDEEILIPIFNPIYSNEYYVIYRRAVSP